ncbi:hypothetical protein ACIBCM_11735 [Streptomyces sp. NPDC051018]|uniref:hypothetical protein n=1 Tax=Streptomyces sp. NPDC051018 TaxID=3365639 RepID=UPI0037998A64
MNEHEWQEIIGTIGLFCLVIIVVTLTVWHFTGGRRSRAREETLKQLAEQMSAGQQRTERQLSELTGRVTELQGRTGALEKILKDVE